MPLPDRLAQTVGLLMKPEAVYGVAETLSNSADGCFLYLGDGDPPNPTEIDYAFDGKIGRAPGNLVNSRRTTPAGGSRGFEVPIQARGLGSLYSAILTPPNEVHRCLQGAGFVPTYSATPTPQWLYSMMDAGVLTGLTARMFAHGSQWDGRGVLLNLDIESEGLGVPIWRFRAVSIASLPTDQALPAVTYAQANIMPPVAQGITLTIGGYAPSVVKSVRLSMNTSTDKPRLAQNVAGGHAGYNRGASVPTMVVTMERPARSAFDPEALRASAATQAVIWGVGSTQYNRYTITMPTAQITGCAPGNDNDSATVEVTLEGHGSTPALNDATNILFN